MRKCNEALFPLLLIPAHYVLQREEKIGIMHIITLWERGVGGWGRGGGQSINFLAKPFSSTSIPTETKRRSPSPDPLASLDALFYIRLRSPQQKPSLQQGLLPIKERKRKKESKSKSLLVRRNYCNSNLRPCGCDL